MRVHGATLDRMRGRLLGSDPPTPGHLLDLPTARVHVQIHGDPASEQTVVYLPDPPNGLDSVAPLLAALAEKYRVIAFEPPGFGWSRARPGFGFTVTDHAEVIGAVMDATETERAVLIAPCLVGYAAMAYTLAHPERVTGLALPQVADWTHAQHWADHVDARGWLRTPWMGQLATMLVQGTLVEGWYRVAEPDPDRRAGLLSIHRARPRSGRLFSLASALQALGDIDLMEGHDRFMHPALLLWGEKDRSHFTEHRHSAARHFTDATCQTVDAGHFPELTRPEILLDWLDRLPGRVGEGS